MVEQKLTFYGTPFDTEMLSEWYKNKGPGGCEKDDYISSLDEERTHDSIGDGGTACA